MRQTPKASDDLYAKYAATDEDLFSKYGTPDSAAPSTMSRVRSFGASLGAGALDATGTGLEGLQSAADWIGSKTGLSSGGGFHDAAASLRGAAGGLTEYAQQQAPDQPFANEIAQGVGSFAPFAVGTLATGGAAGLLGAGAEAAGAVGATAAAIGGAAMQGQSDYERAVQGGAGPEAAAAAGKIGAILGTSLALPVWGVAGKLVARTGMSLERAAGIVLTGTLTAAAQQGVTKAGSNASYKYLVDPEQKILDGVAKSMLVGGIAGGIGAGVGAAGVKLAGRGKGEPKAPGEPTATPAPSVQPEPVQAGTEPAQSQAAPEPATEARKPVEMTPALQKSLDTLHAANPGQEIRFVEPTTEEDAFDKEFLSQRGAKHVLMESTTGLPLHTPGMFEPETGTVFTDANQPTEVHRRATLLHEVLHVAEDAAPEEFAGFVDEVRKADPEGLQASEDWYAKNNPGTSPDALRGESVSRYAETLVHYIEAQRKSPERFAEVLNKSKGLREKIRDGLRAILAKVGIKLDSSMQKRAQELIDELGLAPTKDTAMSLKVAQRFGEVIDGLVGTKYAGEEKPAAAVTEPKPPRLAVRENKERTTGSIGEKIKGLVREAKGVDTNVGTHGEPKTQETPAHTLYDKFRTVSYQYLTRAEKIKSAFGLKTDLVQAVERLPGRTKSRLKDFEVRDIKPLKENLKTYGIEQWEAGRYLKALHAPDANALAIKRYAEENPGKKNIYGLQSNPSTGVSNAEAAKTVAAYEADPKRGAGFKAIATIMRRVSDEKLKQLVKDGLVDQETADQWRADLGPNYVSMHDSTLDLVEQHFGTTGKAGVKGPESKKRKGGSKAQDSQIISNTLAGALDKIVRGAHNEVSNAVGDFAKELNRPDLMETVVNDKDVAIKAPRLKPGEELYSYKLKGHQVDIIIRDPALARAIKRAGMETGGSALRNAAKLMSFYKQLQTGWNIDWSLANFPSDLGDALITVQREGKGFGRKVMKNIPQALKATWNAEHDTGRKSAFDKLLKEADEDGALLGIAGIRSAEDIAKDLNKLDTKNPVIAIKEWVEATGGTFEKSVRLALYKASIDLGLSRDDAGRIARETTTPFVRKGEWTQGLGLLYAFFGARVNGAAIALNAIRHPRVLKALGLMVGLDAALTLMNRAIMGDDDDGQSNWDKKRRDEKQNYFMLGFPNSEKALKLHVPRSYQWVHQLAMGMADMASGDYKASDFGADMATSVLNAFTPADTNTDAPQAITPTALRPIMQVYANKDSFGKAINPDYPHDKRPASEQTFKDTSPLAKDVSRLTNWLTGGDQVTEGAVSLKPGTLEHLTHFMLGGAGATALRLLDAPGKIASGEAGANDIPLARKVMTTADTRYDQREFYATTKEIEKLAERVDSYRKLGEREKAQALIEENPTLWMRRVSAKAKADQVGKLRDRMDKLPEDSVERAQLEARIKAIMSGFNKLVRETKVRQ